MPRRFHLPRATLVALLLAACGGEPAAPEPLPTPPEPLPVLATIEITTPGDSLRASDTLTARIVARDTKNRDMTVGFIAWRTSDPSVLTVATSGAVLALRAGVVTLAATVGEVVGSRVIRVLPPPGGPLPVASVTMTPFISDLDVGGQVLLLATPRDFAGTPLADRLITYSTNDSAIAIVAPDGSVTGRAAGTALIDVRSEGQRAAAYVRVRAPMDTSVVVKVAVPVDNTVVGDDVRIVATVRAIRDVARVEATVGGTTLPMVREELVSPSGLIQYRWVVTADLSLLPVGPLAVVVTATDVIGARGVEVVALVRNPKVAGGGARPPANK